jgi:hypothetical protein
VSDVAYLTIPAKQVEAVTKTVLGLYGARAEALGAVALAAEDISDDRLDIEHARRELRAIEDALFDLGWPDGPSDGPVEIVGRPTVLREVARMSLLDSTDAVAEALLHYDCGTEGLVAVQRAVEAVVSLLDVFATAEAPSD